MIHLPIKKNDYVIILDLGFIDETAVNGCVQTYQGGGPVNDNELKK